MSEARIVYFTNKGPENMDEVLQIAKKRAEQLGIRTILVATTVGDTGARAAALLEGFRVVVVSHATGYRQPNLQELTEENRRRIEEAGATILTSLHAFGGIGRAARKKFNTYHVEEIAANVLRLFGDGMKAACEITMMAADAGLVRTDEEVIAIAGTGRGADTAIVLQPVNTQDFFNLRVKEILCKPRF
ncbi:MAG: hypothetical protein HYX88_02515 [Chloroflexi bacterium]|nr:hypothetical protein [Chloroflexota bacterium]